MGRIALSFGCAVGWGAFVMPGTAFLPVAGPLGTLIGLGVVVFRGMFSRDRNGRLGTSTVAWIVLLFFIFFSGHMWNRQKTRLLTDRVVDEISERFAPVDRDGNVTEEERAAQSFLALVNDILDLSRRESGEAELHPLPTDCRALLREVEESFRMGAPKKGVEMRAAIGEMPTLLVDHLLLRHIAVNLVSNAVKFTERGFVEVRGRFDRDAGGETGTLVFEVEDSGVGIGEEDKQKIDSPYTQVASKVSRNGGTGLGLAVCRQFAEAMGGKMTFESELGKGFDGILLKPANLESLKKLLA